MNYILNSKEKMFNEKLNIYFCHDKRNKPHLLKIIALRYNLHNKIYPLKHTI